MPALRDMHKMNYKLILVWVFSLAISIILGISISVTFTRQIDKNVYDTMKTNIEFAEGAYNIFVNQMKMGMLQASVEPGIKDMISGRDKTGLDKLFSDWAEHRYYVDEWYALDAQSHIISSFSRDGEYMLKLDKLGSKVMILKTPITGTERLKEAVDEKDGTLIQYAAIPIKGGNNEVIGAIITAMRLEDNAYISKEIMNETGMFSIITAGRKVISSNIDSGISDYSTGKYLPEEIGYKVIDNNANYIGKLILCEDCRRSGHYYYGAFRPIKDAEGKIIGSQGLAYYSTLAETSTKYVRSFAALVTVLFMLVFSMILISYNRTQNILDKEKSLSKRLGVVKKFSDMVRQATTEDEVYELLFDLFKGDKSIIQVLIVRKDYESNELTHYKAMDEDSAKLDRFKKTPLESCWAVKTAKEFVCNDLQTEFSCRDFHSEAGSYLCIPIVLGGNISGTIQLQSSEKNYFTEERIADIKIFVDTIIPVISNLRLVESLNKMASTDPLTKVFNRRHLDGYLEKQINISKNHGYFVSVIMIDIDHFKRFNDTYGHDAGDYVLMQFADTIRRNSGEEDMVARFGGEEFVVVLPHADLETAYKAAENIRHAVENISLKSINENEPPTITCSLGIACYPVHGTDMEKLIHSADKALYSAKKQGRNQAVVYRSSGDSQADEAAVTREEI